MKKVDSGGQRLFLLVVLFFLIVASTLLSGGSGSQGASGSVFSNASRGRRAALLLLQELGFEARSWAREPGFLGVDHSVRGSVLFLSAKPPEPLAAGTQLERGEDLGLRDRAHYLRYMEEGGTIVCRTQSDILWFFGEDLGIETIQRLHKALGEDESSLRSESAILPTEEELDLEWKILPQVFDEGADLDVEIFLADKEDRPIACSFGFDRGRLLLLNRKLDPFSNHALDQDDNALLLVRIVDFFGAQGPILFDEYALGLWQPETPLQMAFTPRSLLFTLHAAFFFGLLLLRAAWVRSFPRDPLALESIAPLSRAQGFSAFLIRYRRFDLLTLLLRRGVMRRLARRAGRRDGKAMEAGSEPIQQEEVDSILEALLPHAAPGSLEETADERCQRWRKLFLDASPDDVFKLEELGVQLGALEECFAQVEAKERRGGESPVRKKG